MSEHDHLTVWLETAEAESLPRIGGKGQSLARLLQAGLRVPAGFAITTRLYEQSLLTGGGEVEFAVLFKTLLDHGSAAPEPVRLAAAALQQRAKTTAISASGLQSIALHYRELSARRRQVDPPVAVRSSAACEDKSSASFAGQFETCLWVRGEAQLVDAVRSCWASLFSPRALAYRLAATRKDPHLGYAMGIVVQEMVDAGAAGVAFTLNPKSGDRSKVVIEGNWGLGSSVVSGEVTPDHFMVDKVTLGIDTRRVAHKALQDVVDEASNTVLRIAAPAAQAAAPCLGDDELLELTRVATRIERLYGCPQDVEWALDRAAALPHSLYILQSRPETRWSQRPTVPPATTPTMGYLGAMVASLSGRKVKG